MKSLLLTIVYIVLFFTLLFFANVMRENNSTYIVYDSEQTIEFTEEEIQYLNEKGLYYQVINAPIEKQIEIKEVLINHFNLKKELKELSNTYGISIIVD